MVNLRKALNTPYGVYILKWYKTDVNLLNLNKFMWFRFVCMPIQVIKIIQLEDIEIMKTVRLFNC